MCFRIVICYDQMSLVLLSYLTVKQCISWCGGRSCCCFRCGVVPRYLSSGPGVVPCDLNVVVFFFFFSSCFYEIDVLVCLSSFQMGFGLVPVCCLYLLESQPLYWFLQYVVFLAGFRSIVIK